MALASPLSKKEKRNQVLINNLKEVLYLSLNKTVFLNKVHLNLLNSFELNRLGNRPFKPLLNSTTRVKYFEFFNWFLLFVFRAFNFNIKYFDLFN